MPYIVLNIACLPWSPSPTQCPIHSLSPADCLLRGLSWPANRDQSGYAPSQWETSLHCNDVSHWLGAYPDWSLRQVSACLHLWDTHQACLIKHWVGLSHKNVTWSYITHTQGAVPIFPVNNAYPLSAFCILEQSDHIMGNHVSGCLRCYLPMSHSDIKIYPDIYSLTLRYQN